MAHRPLTGALGARITVGSNAMFVPAEVRAYDVRSAAAGKTITTDDFDIRIDHSRADVLTTRILGSLGGRGKKRAYVLPHRPLPSDCLVA
ncbi:MAG: hypothetical protein OES46_18860 [Gammaproteobacteria bacterium]|nr:hypothetical protein [Gammaproteobacteria bacterium]